MKPDRESAKLGITETGDGHFVVFSDMAPAGSSDFESASEQTQARLEETAFKRALDAGTAEPTLSFIPEEKRATVQGRDILVEALLCMTASGRPAFTR